ncbi:MAG: hypothetical protein ACRCYX_14065 [Dermatophilaceae bacterium]
MTQTLARLHRADDAQHHDVLTSCVMPNDATTGDVGPHAWDDWAVRVDGERDITVVLDAMPRASALMGVLPGEQLHPLAPVDGVLASAGGVLGPFAGAGRPSRLGTGRGFVRVTGHAGPTGLRRLGLALLVAAALWCASNAALLVAAALWCASNAALLVDALIGK